MRLLAIKAKKDLDAYAKGVEATADINVIENGDGTWGVAGEINAGEREQPASQQFVDQEAEQQTLSEEEAAEQGFVVEEPSEKEVQKGIDQAVADNNFTG